MKWYIFNNKEQCLMFHNKIAEFDSQESAKNFLMGYNYYQFCKENGITYRLLDVKDKLGDRTINLINEQIFFVDNPLVEEFSNVKN